MFSNKMEMSKLDEITYLIKTWRDGFESNSYNPVPQMTRLSEMLETGYYEVINKLDVRMKNKIIYEYMEIMPDYTCNPASSIRNKLITAALRMALGISVVNGYYLFAQPQTRTIRRLISLSMVSIEPMQSYAIGLLAIAMDTSDTVERYRPENSKLVPVFFNKLRKIYDLPDCLFGVKHVIPEFPLNRMMQQAFILRFLTAMKSDLFCNRHLKTVSDIDNLNVIISYLVLEDSFDERLVTETLKYLITLMENEEFCYTFLNNGGLEAILYIPRETMINNELSIVVYTLLQYEGIMLLVCKDHKDLLGGFISLVFWLLDDWEFVSMKQNNYIALFLACNFRFIDVLYQFDSRCGLAKLHRMLDTVANQPLSSKASLDLCVAYKSYLYTHLVLRCQQPQIKIDKSSLVHWNEMMEKILNEDNIEWTPVEYLLQLGSLKSILQIIYNSAYDCMPLESDVIKIECALGVLVIASSSPNVKMLLSESMDFTGDMLTGLDIALKVAINCGFEKFALRIIANCVCGPNIPSEHPDTMLNVVRFSHGFMILVDILKETKDETDGVVTELAKRALKVLLKFDEIKQIVSKILPKDVFCVEEKKETFKEKPNILKIFSNMQLGLQTRAKAESSARQIIYSKYAPIQVFKLQKNNYPLFTCANFVNDANSLITADNMGEIRIYNLDTKLIDEIFITHEAIEHLEVQKGGDKLLLSKASQCTMISSDSYFCSVKSQTLNILKGQSFVEFNHFGMQNIVLGTSWGCATIFDMQVSAIPIQKFRPTFSNQYSFNKATFNIDDRLVLFDGVLFDVTSGTEIYRFEKLNVIQNGVFHPNGIETIINGEVWDLRNFGLLKTVDDLKDRKVLFSPQQQIIYGTSKIQEQAFTFSMTSNFTTLDAQEYETIGNIKVSGGIKSVGVNSSSSLVAVVEWKAWNSEIMIYEAGMNWDKNCY